MWDFDKVAEEVRQRGGMMPTTSFTGYRAHCEFDPNGDLTPDQYDAVYHWYVREVNRALPEWAEWIPATSSIILPIDKVHELDVFFEEYSWDEILNDAFEKYIENYDAIINEEAD